MSKLIFVESTFQLQLANQIKGLKNINYLEKSSFLRLIKIPKFILLILRYKNIYIFDHRNIILIVAIIINFFVKKEIYVVDDGFHSILVDKFKNKYLYRQTNLVKKIIIWFFQNQILKSKRLKKIDSNFKKKVFPSNFKHAVFVDQSDFELSLQKIINDLKSKYDSFDFAKHPRNKKYNLFNYSNTSFENLIDSKIRKDFYGVYSTGLIYALKNNHNVFLIKIDSIKSKVSDLEIDYIKDIQDILIDLGATYKV